MADISPAAPVTGPRRLVRVALAATAACWLSPDPALAGARPTSTLHSLAGPRPTSTLHSIAGPRPTSTLHATATGAVTPPPAAPTTATATTTGAGAHAATTTGAGDSGPPTIAGLQSQAAELATEIRNEGIQLDQLSEQVDGGLIRKRRLTDQLAKLRAATARTDAQVARSWRLLRQDALAVYVDGDQTAYLAFEGATSGEQLVLRDGYASAVASDEQSTLSTLHRLLRRQNRQRRQLAAAEQANEQTIAQLTAAEHAAAAAASARRQTLSQVQGHLAVLVAAAEVAQQTSEAASIGVAPASAGASSAGSRGPTLSNPPSGAALDAPTAAQPTPAQPAPATATAATPAPAPTRPLTAAPVTAPPSPAPVTPAPAPSPATTSPPATTAPATTTPPALSGPNLPAPNASIAVRAAQAELGKPYQWAGAGPNSFDCSGLVMWAWGQAGVSFPHLAQSQYQLTERIPLSDLLPGDLVFFGTPNNVYHVGIYVGNGQMIDAPETGQNVSYSSIYWPELLGAGRVR